jgi:uncharacterized protein YecE (DUF72 family)
VPSNGTITIGTSGWNYAHWKGPFYPSDLARDCWLEYYADRLRSVEVNNTFYQLPEEQTVDAWTSAVPPDFTFAVKASRYITHMKKLKDPGETLERFVPAIEAFGDRLGPVLFQLPPSWNANPDRLGEFLEALETASRGAFGRESDRAETPGAAGGPRGAHRSGRGLRCAFEFRDESWFSEDVFGLLRKHNAAFCIYHLAGRLSPREVTADFVYVRLHGPGGKYEGSYDRRALSGWAGAFSSWAREGLDVFCYFDNDDSGYAAKNATELATMLS